MTNREKFQSIAIAIKALSLGVGMLNEELDEFRTQLEPMLWICQNPGCGAPNTTLRVVYIPAINQYCRQCGCLQNPLTLFAQGAPE